MAPPLLCWRHGSNPNVQLRHPRMGIGPHYSSRQHRAGCLGTSASDSQTVFTDGRFRPEESRVRHINSEPRSFANELSPEFASFSCSGSWLPSAAASASDTFSPCVTRPTRPGIIHGSPPGLRWRCICPWSRATFHHSQVWSEDYEGHHSISPLSGAAKERARRDLQVASSPV
jgi:hypothetical protein